MVQIAVENIGTQRRPLYEAVFGGLRERGATRKAAQDALMSLLLEVASEPEAAPLVIEPLPGEAFALVWFAPREGWTYQIKRPGQPDPYTRDTEGALYEGRLMYLNGVRETRDQVERRARRHLSENLFSPTSPYRTFERVVAHPDDRADLFERECWQRCVKEAEAQGIEDTEAQRRYADARRREAQQPGRCRECGEAGGFHFYGWPCERERVEAADARLARFAAGEQTEADEAENDAELALLVDTLASL